MGVGVSYRKGRVIMAPLRAKSKLQIIKCFKIMEMPIDTLESDSLRKQYYKISRKYHPDLCIEEYKDGNMFARMKASYDFLRNNMNVINESIEALIDFKINNEKQDDEEIIITKKEEKTLSTEERLQKEEMIFKNEQIIIKQTKEYKTIKNCIKIEKALEELEKYEYQEIDNMKRKIEDIYDDYKPYKLVKTNYFVYTLLIILSIILAILAIPTTKLILLGIALICLMLALILVCRCNMHKKNTVFYTGLTGKTLK